MMIGKKKRRKEKKREKKGRSREDHIDFEWRHVGWCGSIGLCWARRGRGGIRLGRGCIIVSLDLS